MAAASSSCLFLYPALQLIEDLRKQLEYLQMFRLEVERGGRGRGPGAGLQEYTARTRESELEQEVRRLRLVLV